MKAKRPSTVKRSPKQTFPDPSLVVGIDKRVPVVGGKLRRYVNFDNAASTPAIRPVLEKVEEFLRWYSNVHRGTGFKSKLSSWAFDESRARVYEFVHADAARKVALFSRNTTESINHLAHRFPFRRDGVVITTVMEHHSNELPWRKVAEVVHVDVTDDGRIDEADLRAKLEQYRGRVQLLAVTGASNVTGYINPVHDYAQWTHAAGAKIFVDAAQLAPHRPVDMTPRDSAACIDFLAFSAHKMYAPFGVGVLVADRSVFEEGAPDLVGGGTVDIVNLENAYWTDLPDKEEAGTPDIVGVVALGSVLRYFGDIGWKRIIDHEAGLTTYALERLAALPKVRLYGDTDPRRARERLGVISFGVDGLPHSLVAAILSYEWGIGTRSGCFCAHPYVKCLLHVSPEESRAMEDRILHRDRSILPGTVRASFGIYNTTDEIDVLCSALKAVSEGRFCDGYRLDKERGEYVRDDMKENFEAFFRL